MSDIAGHSAGQSVEGADVNVGSETKIGRLLGKALIVASGLLLNVGVVAAEVAC